VAWIVRLVKTGVDGEKQFVDVVTINRPDDLIDITSLGLTLAEGKQLLAGLQQQIVAAQARSHAVRWPACRSCGAVCHVKDYRDHAIATLFGQATVRLPRFRCAGCGGHEAGHGWPSHCRSTPELDQLQAHLSTLMTYRVATDVMAQILPFDTGNAPETLRCHTLTIGADLRDQAAVQPDTTASAIAVTLDSTFIRSCEEGERHPRCGSIGMRLQHLEQIANGLSADDPARVAAKAVNVEAVDRLHWRLWNGKAKDAQISIDRIRAVMHHFQGEQGQRKSIAPSRKLWTAPARVGWLSHRPERLAGQLCRTAPGRSAGRHRDHRRHGQLPGEPADEQVTADALVVTGRRSPAASSLRRLQRHARLRLRTEILPRQRSASASSGCRLTPPIFRRSQSW
jgi:hypothetical protein